MHFNHKTSSKCSVPSPRCTNQLNIRGQHYFLQVTLLSRLSEDERGGTALARRVQRFCSEAAAALRPALPCPGPSRAVSGSRAPAARAARSRPGQQRSPPARLWPGLRAPGAGASPGGGAPLRDPRPAEGSCPPSPVCPQAGAPLRLRVRGSRQGLREWVGSDGGCGALPCQG